ncbi:MAG: GIY-YIG nuclease family protein [Proteobacteria bacterium]|nr:GIY-YIG nuclease family protein [Pseudomonadota bacterium]
MKPKPGTYALVLLSEKRTYTQIGRWGRLNIRPGYYIYVGSAFGPGGVLARVSRHCRKAKSKHWHIDYLREFAIIASVWYSHSPIRLEHHWAAALAKLDETEPVKGFGCSDCKCESHLFFAAKEPKLAKFSSVLGGFVKLWSFEPAG